MPQDLVLPPQQRQLLLYNHISYALYVFGLFASAGLLWIVPIFMNYFFRGRATGTWLESHHSWQISTFWGSVIMVVIGWSLFFVGGGAALAAIIAGKIGQAIGWSLLFLVLGSLVLLAGYLWNIYRVARGWIALADKRSVGG